MQLYRIGDDAWVRFILLVFTIPQRPDRQDRRFDAPQGILYVSIVNVSIRKHSHT